MNLNVLMKFMLYFASFKALAGLLTTIITIVIALFAFGVITPDKLTALADVGKDANMWQVALGKIAELMQKGAALVGHK